MTQHRDIDAMVENVIKATPKAPAPPMTAHEIFKAQDRPRMPHRELEALLEELAADCFDDLEISESGHMRYYRWTQNGEPAKSTATERSAPPKPQKISVDEWRKTLPAGESYL